MIEKTEEKDLIIGCYTNYNWDKIKYWVNSINASGFTGEKIMIVMSSDKLTVDKLIEKGFRVIIVGTPTGDRYEHPESRIPVHVERFFHIWHVLEALDYKPRFVITTDVKDVIFQTNPSEWLRLNTNLTEKNVLVVGSESMKYKDEPWGNENLLQTFGQFFHEFYKDNEIYNVGTLAGTYDMIKSLALNIFQMSINRSIPIVDQAVFNFLLWQEPWKSNTLFCRHDSSWAAQLGTTMDPNKIEKFRTKLLGSEPVVSFPDQRVITASRGIPFCIVHQYDRVPGIKGIIEARYDD